MTGPDSTPDLSWLNKKEEASAAEGSQDNLPNQEGESETDEVVVNDQTDSFALDESVPDDEVNPTAETWIEPAKPFSEPFVSPKVEENTAADNTENSSIHEDEEDSEEDHSSDPESVFDDHDDDEHEDLADNGQPTVLMPGSEPSPNASDPEDVTVVLPEEQESTEPAESFAQPTFDEPPAFSKSFEEQPKFSPNIGGEGGFQEETFALPEGEEEFASPNEEEAKLETAADTEAPDSTDPVSEENGTDASEQAVDDSESGSTESLLAPETQPSDDSTASAENDQAESAVNADSEPASGSNLKIVLLASYASAMTIIALALFMSRGNGAAKPHHLESLPDVAPEPAESLSYVPVEATLPSGHLLAIGEKQRFGNIEVEPLRVVKEPIEFAHYSGDTTLERPASEQVYKLWLRFTNVSEDQEIAPLDGDLLLRWVAKSDLQREFSNYYIFSPGTRDDSKVIPAYRHSKTSDWDMKDQQLGHVLKPGESFETYITSTEQPKLLDGDELTWRLQFRKGYSPKGNGVTTLVDIAFKEDQVETPS